MPTKPHQSNLVVLIVDDSPEALGMINEILDSNNISTLVALDGKQALRSAETALPDLILLDAIMPVMNGFQTCTKLKENPKTKNIPVIFMTGLSDTESIVKGFDSGGCDYLTKPINTQELMARIQVHLNNSRQNISARSALDITGQNLMVTDAQGFKLWETPQVSDMFKLMEEQDTFTHFCETVKTWIQRKPRDRDQFQYKEKDLNYRCIHIGLTNNKEHYLKIINDEEIDETNLLKETFKITPRESDVFLWLAKGKTNREIAQILDMKPRTVNKHLEQLFKKLEVDNRTTAAAMAIPYLQK